ncbi:MAG: CvpA family protein [Candidatus Omnitrophota bacterium]
MSTLIQNINWLDIVFIILLLGMGYKGASIGVGGQILSLVGWVLLLFTSLTFYTKLSTDIFGFLTQDWARPVSFVIIAGTIFVIIKVLEKISGMISGEDLAPIEKFGGIVIASVRACLFFGVIGIMFLLMPLDFTRTAVVEGSFSGMFFVNLDAKIYSTMTGRLGLTEKQTGKGVVKTILSPQRKEK